MSLGVERGGSSNEEDFEDIGDALDPEPERPDCSIWEDVWAERFARRSATPAVSSSTSRIPHDVVEAAATGSAS